MKVDDKLEREEESIDYDGLVYDKFSSRIEIEALVAENRLENYPQHSAIGDETIPTRPEWLRGDSNGRMR